MHCAVIGTGISGMLTARLLHGPHKVTVFEARARLGGHTHTRSLQRPSGRWNVDSGFIVFNEQTYPGFIRMLELLDVPSQASTMSFSVRCEDNGLEYNPTSLNGLFAQRSNLLRPSFYGMLRDILRFFDDARAFLEAPNPELSLAEFLAEKRYRPTFIERHIVPLGCAIWSASQTDLLGMPMQFFARFFANHGFLQVDERSAWRVVRGGSMSYIEPLVAPFRQNVRLASPVVAIRRLADGPEIKTRGGRWERFDAVVLAVHSDQALAMLTDPSPSESSILGAIAYQPNDVVLHTDTRVLPKNSRARASWNAFSPREPQQACSLTYDMNRLQSLDAPETFCVTLNRRAAIDASKIIASDAFSHPRFTAEAVRAQARHAEINGQQNTYYCGAYWGYGFHEDGVNSALRIGEMFGRGLDDALRPADQPVTVES